MHEYNQPDFYHFSQDSIRLAEYAFKKLKKRSSLKVLDLCCGSGVIGIEFFRKHQSVKLLDFVEKQIEFLPCIEANTKRYLGETPSNIYLESFESISLSYAYDLILANPPFYLEGTARAPLNKLKHRCHFLEKETMNIFFNVLAALKSKEGTALFLGRKDQAFINVKLKTKAIFEELSFGKTSIFSF